MPAAAQPTELPERFNLATWLLDPNVAARPDKVAVHAAARSLTYAEVATETARVQWVLEKLGVAREQRVLLVLPDVPEFVTTWLAVLRAGAVFAMVNPRLPAEDYAYYLEYSRAPVAVVHHEAWETFGPAIRSARFLRHVLVVGGEVPVDPGVPALAYEEAVPAAEAADPVETHRDEVAGWLFTSGTSGKPKAALHFHQDFAWNIERYARQVLRMRADDVTLAVSKLFFGYATGTNLMFPFAAGAATALFPGRSTPEAVVANAAAFHPTVLSAVPTTLLGILDLPEAETRAALSSLRLVISAGEALPPDLQVRFQERFGVEILDGIGSAEMFHIYITNYPGDVRPGSLGKLVPGYEARIVGPDGSAVPRGESGVLWVKGGSTAAGYWLAREKSRDTFHGDWTVTGDLFRQDEQGYFYYEGRADDMLKVGGIWVAPREVEECLLRHEAVQECCVVGVQGSDGLVVPLAYVVVADGFVGDAGLSERLIVHAKEKLARYKAPRIIRYVDALPRNDRGKIARAELRSQAQADGARR